MDLEMSTEFSFYFFRFFFFSQGARKKKRDKSRREMSKIQEKNKTKRNGLRRWWRVWGLCESYSRIYHWKRLIRYTTHKRKKPFFFFGFGFAAAYVTNEFCAEGGEKNKRIKCMEWFCLFFSLACHQLMNDSLPDIRHFFPTPRDGKKEYRKVVAAATKYVQDSPLPLNKLYDWLDSILTETLSASPGRNRRNGEKLFAK